MNKISKLGIGLLVLAFTLGVGGLAYGQTATTTATGTVEQLGSLLQQIKLLQAQLAELQTKQASLRQELQTTLQLTRTLALGMSGEDVKALQALLASDPDIYPEGLITGFFGPLTEKAVEKLQARFGIEAVGIVGPLTRNTLNGLFGHINKGKGSLNRGPGNIFDILELDDDDDEVDLSEFTPGTSGIKVCHIPAGNVAAAHTIAVGGPAVQAHLRHGDTLGACADDDNNEDNDDEEDDDDDDDDDDTDTTAPDISDIGVNVASTTASSTDATVTWETDEDADSTVWYSTDEDFETDDADTEEETDSDLVTNHSVDLSGLTASTTYYFMVGSEDEAGNQATSSVDSFITP